MTSRERILRITRLGFLIALIILMTFIPNIGYIQTGLFAITTIHIPVIIGATMMGPLGGLLLGLTWGLTSYFYAMTIGTIEAAIFLNPLVSIVPRILVGLIVSYSALALKKWVRWPASLQTSVVALIGTLSNTVLVLGAIFTFEMTGLIAFNQAVETIFTIVISLNGLLELFGALILVPAVVGALNRLQVRPKA
jgi:uncharacterized membrane protein